MTYYIVIVNILLAFKLVWDFHAKHEQKRIINHSRSAIIDGVLYVAAAYLFFGLNGYGWAILAIGYRWLAFDLLFNLLNRDKWNHYGQSSYLDRFLMDLGDFHLLPKIILIITGILLIVL